jgi:tetrahydromethanopterin S-methyltransferase subunit C
MRTAWDEYTKGEAPWFDKFGLYIGVLVFSPLLAFFASLAGLIETAFDELVINQLNGLISWVDTVITSVFWGSTVRREVGWYGIGNPVPGVIDMLRSGWLALLRSMAELGLLSYPVAVLAVIVILFIIGQVMARG